MTNILIASYLEPEFVEQIRRAATDSEVVYAPELLPVPRYRSDHIGVNPALSGADRRRWSELLGAAEVMFDFDWEEPGAMPHRCPRLAWVQATSAGAGDTVSEAKLADAPFTITTAAGVHAVPLSEFVTGGLLYFIKDFPRLKRDQAAHRWERFAGGELAGRAAVVVGVGGVGRQVGRTLSQLGVAVTGVAQGQHRDREAPVGFTRVVGVSELDAVLEAADLLVVACPLTDKTRGMIGQRQLELLADGALLVNIGRGPVIDEPALLTALESGRLAGAVLDVFDQEPLPERSPFWELPNVILCPHSASTVFAENGRLTELFVRNLRRFQSGAPLLNIYDSSRGY